MTTKTRERPRRADPLKANGLEVRRYVTPAKRKCFVLCWAEGGYYRSREPLADSKFAWVRPPGAAARFATRGAARQVGLDYLACLDTVSDHAMPSPDPEQFIYPARWLTKSPMETAGQS